MYFFEWGSWQAKLETAEARKNDLPLEKIYACDDEKEQAATRLSVSQTAKSRGPVYLFNDCILEMRCGILESKRGLISIFSTAIIIYILKLSYEAIGFATSMIESISISPSGFYASSLLPIFLFSTIALLTGWLYLKYGFRFTRLEMFTSRHLLIRFNCKTQQVHLHRPSYCGGIVTLPWRGLTSSGTALNIPAVSPLEVPLVLCWSSRVTGTLQTELACVGKPTVLQSEIRDEWEFIRRFMDEGPQGLPRPHITSHFPWPWQAFTPQFEGLEKYFRGASIKIKIGLILISPAFLILGMGHWLSLMLCWKPRWPKIIRQAGMPGKPVPALTTLADYPAHTQQRLRENAHLWQVHPGSPPEKKPPKKRERRINAKPELEYSAPITPCSNAESSASADRTHESN